MQHQAVQSHVISLPVESLLNIILHEFMSFTLYNNWTKWCKKFGHPGKHNGDWEGANKRITFSMKQRQEESLPSDDSAVWHLLMIHVSLTWIMNWFVSFYYETPLNTSFRQTCHIYLGEVLLQCMINVIIHC